MRNLFGKLKQFTNFTIVGLVGFAVDVGILLILIDRVHWSSSAARAVSIATAITVTWLLNRFLAFRDQRSASVAGEYLAYAVVQLFGAAINFLVFAFFLACFPAFWQAPVIAAAIGSGTAMLFNFLALKRLVFVHSL